MLNVSERLKEKYPGIHFGIMVLENVINPENCHELDLEKEKVESELRQKYGPMDRKSLREEPVLNAYFKFYKSFKKTYHVELQLISVAQKGKSIPSVQALVEAMFMAELNSQILTAVHDYSKVGDDFFFELAEGTESFVGMGGKEKQIQMNDIVFKSKDQIFGTVLQGPDHETRITLDSKCAVFAAYGVPGVEKEAIENHLNEILEYVIIIKEDTELRGLFIS